MLVILEGPDASGKSTLVRELQLLDTFDIKHCGPPETDDPFSEYQRALHAIKGPTIYDRFFHGECIWGPLYRQQTLHDWQLFYLELEAAAFKPVVVWCDADSSVIRERLSSRSDMTSYDKIVYERIDEVRAAHAHVKSKSRISKLYHYDSGSESPQDAARAVYAMLQRVTLPGHYTGVGNVLDAPIAIVGDRFTRYQDLPLPGSKFWFKMPFVQYRPFCHAKCSQYLWDSVLMSGDVTADMLYVTNSIKDWMEPDQSSATLHSELLRRHSIVTLGKHATQRVRNLGFNCNEVPHPQFWKRFKFKRMAEYANQLKEAMYALPE